MQLILTQMDPTQLGGAVDNTLAAVALSRPSHQLIALCTPFPIDHFPHWSADKAAYRSAEEVRRKAAHRCLSAPLEVLV